MATKPRSPKRSRSASTEPVSAEQSPELATQPTQTDSADGKNLSPLEGTISVYGGVLLLVAALFPRTFKQFFLLGLGAAFIYRGQSRHCGVYQAIGVDTNKAGLLKQLSNTLLS